MSFFALQIIMSIIKNRFPSQKSKAHNERYKSSYKLMQARSESYFSLVLI